MKRKKITKASITVDCLLKGYSVEQIMEEMLKVFPGSGTTENSIYFYASKTPGVSLSGRNDGVDNAAYEALQAKLHPVVVDETEASPEEEEPTVEETTEEMVERMKAEIRAEIEAEYATKQPKVRIRKKKDMVG